MWGAVLRVQPRAAQLIPLEAQVIWRSYACKPPTMLCLGGNLYTRTIVNTDVGTHASVRNRTEELPMNHVRVRRIGSLLVLAASLLVAVAPTQAAATTIRNRTTVPFDVVVDNPCTGEPVTLSGAQLVIFHLVFDERGGVHAHFSLVPQQVRGVGLRSGTTYHAVGGGAIPSTPTPMMPSWSHPADRPQTW